MPPPPCDTSTYFFVPAWYTTPSRPNQPPALLNLTVFSSFQSTRFFDE
jgi:hypothetical protein